MNNRPKLGPKLDPVRLMKRLGPFPIIGKGRLANAVEKAAVAELPLGA